MAQKKGTRRAGRTLAFQVLYGLAFAPAEAAPSLEWTLAENPAALDETSDEVKVFARELVRGVWAKRDELDQIIHKHSKHWKLHRIAKVELAILRLALYEMLHCADIPLKVAINEGIELSKQFGDENSRNFINGILDAAAKTVDNGDLGVDKKF
ncbi:MAG TPA: transcription antitermination factor NusB [Desulfovibrio sp.]|jgi:N utilization substance protein B|uniref:transcription antitermination factor NusB n=1 Tax=Desulfovibrio TaxID=872 RepID=UPI002C0CCEDD|nr:transcription antitermination factor NusB [Desulfovibrio sp.]HMM39595.1 transcription antitermination factor NusB [Desulfovibrio sp.]